VELSEMPRRKTKKKRKGPDDYLAFGTMEAARFGKQVVMRNRATEAEHKQTMVRLAEGYDDVIRKIDALVDAIRSRVQELPADRLMHRAYWELAGQIMMGEESPERGDLNVSMRMVDYVQSVIASTPRAPDSHTTLDDDAWSSLRGMVADLFDAVTTEYQLRRRAKEKLDDPNRNDAMDTFRFAAELIWCNVRGHRYQPHECQALLELILPHSAAIQDMFGVSSQQLVDGLETILHRLTFGPRDAMRALDEVREASLPAMEELERTTDEQDPKVLLQKVTEREPALGRRLADAMDDVVGLGIFDIDKNTKLPAELVRELSWAQGEETEFWAPGEFCGWPFRIWPVFKRPFLRIDERCYCFDAFSLFDHVYRCVQRIVVRRNPAYKDTWNRLQKEVTEELPFRYLQKIMPASVVRKSVYYPWRHGNKEKWFECDGILEVDDHLFIVEVKAGAFTYTSPSTDLPAYLKSLQELVAKPYEQGYRFADYLGSAPEVGIFDDAHVQIATLRCAAYRQVTVCAVTLDSFTELAARAEHLGDIGLNVSRGPVWCVSIDDLRVYADLFRNHLSFLHFVEQRMRAGGSKAIDLDDEMDHLGMYLAHNDYVDLATDMARDPMTKLRFAGYKEKIDQFYSDRLRGLDPEIPTQAMPERLREIIDFLSRSAVRERAELASMLLGLGQEFRDAMAAAIATQLSRTAAGGSTQAFSAYGDVAITFYTWAHGTRVDSADAIEHTMAVMALHNEAERVLVEFRYGPGSELIGVDWHRVKIDALSPEKLARVRRRSEGLRKGRMATAAKQGGGKIGRNDDCPCGSGRKFKKCCLSAKR
jgi:hypothetical protein